MKRNMPVFCLNKFSNLSRKYRIFFFPFCGKREKREYNYSYKNTYCIVRKYHL
jgi:hypothetical protein